MKFAAWSNHTFRSLHHSLAATIICDYISLKNWIKISSAAAAAEENVEQEEVDEDDDGDEDVANDENEEDNKSNWLYAQCWRLLERTVGAPNA